MKKKFLPILAIVVIVFLAFGGVAYASDSAVPGDLLYPVDILAENVQRVLIFDPITETEFEAEVLSERVEELEVISEDGELTDIEDLVVVIDEQGDKVRTVEKTMNEVCTGDNCDSGEQNRVVEMVMEQNQEHVEAMNQVQNQIETKYGVEECSGACGKIVDVVETFIEVDNADVEVDETVEENGGSGNGNN